MLRMETINSLKLCPNNQILCSTSYCIDDMRNIPLNIKLDPKSGRNKIPSPLSGIRLFYVTYLIIAIIFSSTSLNAQTFPVIDTIKVGRNPRRAVVTPNGAEVYVSNEGDNTVSVIRTRDNQVEITIPLDPKHIKESEAPQALGVSPDGRWVFVGHLGEGSHPRKKAGVSVIDVNQKKVVDFIRTPDTVADLAIRPAGPKGVVTLYLAMVTGGLGKLFYQSAGRYSYKLVDHTRCPVAVVFTPHDGKRAYVNYQCAPDPDPALQGTSFSRYWGHDPIRVFDADQENWVAEIANKPNGERMPNVGSFMAISPTDPLLWANGGDACSRIDMYGIKDKDGNLKFEGCPTAEPPGAYKYRGIINIIQTNQNIVIRTLPFEGYPAGKKDFSLGASVPTFFPNGKKVAVSAGKHILIFDKDFYFFRRIENLVNAGNLAFTPDGARAYVPVQKDGDGRENIVKVLQVEGPAQIVTEWEVIKWVKRQPWHKLVGLLVPVILILWAFLSYSFAQAFANFPTLRLPLDLDVFLRKHRSKLVSIYLKQLRRNMKARRGYIKVVSLPLIINGNSGFNTESWLQDFPHKFQKEKEKGGHYRVAIQGDGGTGKTVLLTELTELLIEQGYVPMLMEAANYAEDLDWDKWIGKVLSDAQIPVSSLLWRRLSNVVYLIDQASEVRLRSKEAFWQLIKSFFDPGVPEMHVVVAGRWIGDPATGVGKRLPWEEEIMPAELTDEDIRRIGSAYLDPTGQSQEINDLPTTIKNITKKPTAFMVSKYAQARRTSVRSIKTEQELFQEILDKQVQDTFATRPIIVRLILTGLVQCNYLKQGVPGDRGLPRADILVGQVQEIVDRFRLKEKYGEPNILGPADFVDRLLPSGLVYPIGSRYLFFHDSFEDWLAEEAKEMA